MSKKQSSETKVTRISASDDTARKPVTAKVASKKATKPQAKEQRNLGIIGRIAGYFKGAWYELRQVHWPTRSATWGLTGAVLAFTLFFVIFITMLDAAFKYLFEVILK